MINAHSWFYCNKQILKLSFLFLYFRFLASGNTVAHVNTFVIQEIRHAFSCLLQNILQSGQMMFEMEKPRSLNRGFCISNSISQPRRLFCNKHKNVGCIFILLWQQNIADRFSVKKDEVGRYVTSFLYKTCRESCSMLQPCDV